MDEESIRERLTSLAGETPLPTEHAPVLRGARRRIARNAVLSSVLIGSLIWGLAGFVLRSDEKASFVATGRPVEVSAASGSLRCIAHFVSDTVGPGHSTGLTFFVENIGSESVELPRELFGRLQVQDSHGSVVWPAYEQAMMGPGMRNPVQLAPKQRMRIPVSQPIVQWPGRLTANLQCTVGKELHLPSVRLAVREPLPIAAEAALRRAEAKVGGLFDPCSPKIDGSWSEGVLKPPDAGYKPPEFDREMRPPAHDIRPMAVRCAAKLKQRPGFWIVDLVLVSPASAPEVPDESPVPRDVSEPLPGTGSMEVARFQFVVTSEATVNTNQVGVNYRTRAAATLRKVFYAVFSYGAGEHGVVKWRRSAEGMCGEQGGTGWSIDVRFINACPP